MNGNVQAVLDRAQTVVFWPTAEEIHEFVKSWWPIEDADIVEFIGQNLDKMISPSIRWYRDAQREKNHKNAWREWLLKMWYDEDPRMAVIAELHNSGIPKGKEMENEWHRKTGFQRALFYRVQQEYLAQRSDPAKAPEPEKA